jgi:hypothetical protein
MPSPDIKLCLAAGKIAGKSDFDGMRSHFDDRGWELLDPKRIFEKLVDASKAGYENDVAFVVSKLIHRELAKKAKKN